MINIKLKQLKHESKQEKCSKTKKKKNNVANLLDASEFGHLNQLKTEHKLNIKLIAQNLF